MLDGVLDGVLDGLDGLDGVLDGLDGVLESTATLRCFRTCDDVGIRG